MKKWLLGAFALSIGLFACLGGDVAVQAQGKDEKKDGKDEKIPTIKEIMKKTMAKGGYQGKLKTELKAPTVKWDDVSKMTKDYAALGEKLGKNKPPKGDDASWEKLTKEFAENAKALNKAAEDKDAKAALAAHDKLQKSCKACHDKHQDN